MKRREFREVFGWCAVVPGTDADDDREIGEVFAESDIHPNSYALNVPYVFAFVAESATVISQCAYVGLRRCGVETAVLQWSVNTLNARIRWRPRSSYDLIIVPENGPGIEVFTSHLDVRVYGLLHVPGPEEFRVLIPADVKKWTQAANPVAEQKARQRGPGVLEVGLAHDETRVILNYPQIDQYRYGDHILFTPAEAHSLGILLLKKASECKGA